MKRPEIFIGADFIVRTPIAQKGYNYIKMVKAIRFMLKYGSPIKHVHHFNVVVPQKGTTQTNVGIRMMPDHGMITFWSRWSKDARSARSIGAYEIKISGCSMLRRDSSNHLEKVEAYER